MTQLLKPELVASKALRKKRQQADDRPDTPATERALASLRRSMNKQVQKEDHEARLRAKAIADTIPEFIAAMDEEVLAPFFFSLERLATAANRRRIATHPLRPAIVNEMHEDADAEDARVAEEDKREQGKAAERNAKAAKAMPQAETPGDTSQ